MTSASAGPAASISTNVPSRGLARRTLFETAAIGRQYPFHAFGDMRRGQRRAGNIPDVAVDLERTRVRLSDELREPARTSDLAAVRFAVLQDLDFMHGPCRGQRDGVVDIEVFADDPVENEIAGDTAARFSFPDPSRLDWRECSRGESLLLR